MNPMTNVKNITKLCEEELKGRNKTSWHEQYRGSAWIFVGGLPYDLTEGDITCVFSQYGEPINVNLVRDKDTGKSKGFCFICYEDQRSTDLAVDNLNGIKLLGRTLRVDHVEKYKPPKNVKDEKSETAREIKKEKGRGNLEDHSVIFDQVVEKNNQPSKSQKKGTEKHHEKHDDSSDSDVHSRKKKELKIKRKRKRRDSDAEIKLEDKSERSEAKKKKKSKNKRKLSSSSSSLSSSTTSLSSLSSCSESKKDKKLKTERYEIQKRNKTIRDLRREAKLIQAELKRRQQADERMKKCHRDVNGKQHSRKESRREDTKPGSSKEHLENNIERLRERSEDRRREKKDSSSSARDEHHSKTTDKVLESSRKHKYL